jgi:hypothetical protein
MLGRQVLADRQQHAVAPEHVALVGEVDGRQLEPLARDVGPHVELGPVGDREGAQMLALVHAAVPHAPQLGALALGLPAAVGLAHREHSLLGPGALLVAARAADRRVEAVLLDRVEQHPALKPVARATRLVLLHATGRDRLRNRRDD